MTRRPLGTASLAASAQLDEAIDALLGGRPVVVGTDDRELLELLPMARMLHEMLPRFHPRFGFEERLAGRLRGGEPQRPASPPAAAAEVVALPVDANAGAGLAGSSRSRGLIAGGAIASGLSLALSLAGAALVAWRRSRSTEGIG